MKNLRKNLTKYYTNIYAYMFIVCAQHTIQNWLIILFMIYAFLFKIYAITPIFVFW